MAYIATATTTGGRNGHVQSSDALIQFDLSVPKEMGGPGKPGTTNPEQFFAAGYSACFGGAVDYAAKLEKVQAGDITVTCNVTIDQNANGFFLAVGLSTHIEGVDRLTAERLVNKAHLEICPYSKATRNNIRVTLEVV